MVAPVAKIGRIGYPDVGPLMRRKGAVDHGPTPVDAFGEQGGLLILRWEEDALSVERLVVLRQGHGPAGPAGRDGHASARGPDGDAGGAWQGVW